MRLRPFVALSVAAASAVLLAGCSGLGGAATPSPTADAGATNLCDALAAPGAASDAVTVNGDPGTSSTVTFDAPLDVTELQSTIITEGSGDPVAAGDFVQFALSAFNAETGDKLDEIGYNPGEALPIQISADNPLGQILGCGKPGQRVVAAFPATDSAAAEVYVVDLLERIPAAAWGEEQAPVEGMPTVTLDENGVPTIAVPDTEPPTETEVAVLKQGNGYEVQDGDTVLIQFRGARWSTGELFDGGDTWASGTPYSGQTTGFVAGFQKALVGFTVGSQVLVVITPADGYGDGAINESDLVGETIVFVVDILGAQKPLTQ